MVLKDLVVKKGEREVLKKYSLNFILLLADPYQNLRLIKKHKVEDIYFYFLKEFRYLSNRKSVYLANI